MSSLSALQQRLFELHRMSPFADYSNILSHTVLANPAPPLVLPRTESLLSSHSSTITPIELALVPGPEELAPVLSIPPSPI